MTTAITLSLIFNAIIGVAGLLVAVIRGDMRVTILVFLIAIISLQQYLAVTNGIIVTPVFTGICVISTLFFFVSLIVANNAVSHSKRARRYLDDANAAMAAVGGPLVLADRSGKILSANQTLEELMGYSESDLLGRSINKLLAEDSQIDPISLRRKDGFKLELNGITREGDAIALEAVVNQTRLGQQALILVTFRDLTQNRQLESSIRSRQERMLSNQRTLLELAKSQSDSLQTRFENILRTTASQLQVRRVSIWLYDDVQSALHCKMLMQDNELKLDSKSLLRKDYPTYFSALDGEDLTQCTDAMADPHFEEFRSDYLPFHGITSILEAPIRAQASIKGLVCCEHIGPAREWTVEDQDFAKSISDLCALALAEHALRKSEVSLREALQVARMAGFKTTPESPYLEWSQEMFELIDASPETYDTSKAFQLKQIHPDDREDYMEAMNQAVRTGNDFRGDCRFKKPNGEYIWLATVANMITDESGKTVEIVGSMQDITERKNAELEKLRLQSQLRQSQRLETIGTLAGGIAHDFNNILTPIMGYTDLSLTIAEPGSELEENLTEVMRGAGRARDLVDQILMFSKRDEQEPHPVRMSALVEEALALIKPSVPLDINIEVRMDFDGPVVGDESQLHQVLLNICTNAWQAMSGSAGSLTITMSEASGTELPTPDHTPEKGYLHIAIADTGPGMDEETASRIFEPFFTTKPVDQGTGLGLSVVHGIVQNHQGQITVDSKPGEGSTFHLYLPLVTDDYERPHGETKGKSILVVDDDISTTTILNTMLVEMGYNVFVANTSSDALTRFNEDTRKFDLVIADYSLPVMNGALLCAKLHQARDDLPVCIMTGFGEKLTDEEINTRGVTEILPKPITESGLEKALGVIT